MTHQVMRRYVFMFIFSQKTIKKLKPDGGQNVIRKNTLTILFSNF